MAGKQANPSGASDEQIAEGERVGKAVGPDVDKSFHVYEFDEPEAEAETKKEKK